MADRIEEIKARLEAATPGPWAVAGERRYTFDNGSYEYFMAVRVDHESGPWERIMVKRPVAGQSPDAEFIANAPEDIAYLLERVRESEALIELADDLAFRVTVLESDHSLKFPLDILIRDSKVVSKAVNAYLTARAALRTTKEKHG